VGHHGAEFLGREVNATMPAYPNPFRRGFGPTFQPQTDTGRALQAATAALFAGQTPVEQEALAQKAALNEAHMRLYGEQASKTAAERAILEARQRLLSQDGMDETAANMAGTTLGGVRTARDYVAGTPGVTTMPPAGPVLEAIQRAQAALRTGAMDATVDPTQIAKAFGAYRDQAVAEGVRDGTIDPTRAAQAAILGKVAPFSIREEGAGNVLTGDFRLNPVGEGEARYRNAQAGAQDALARSSDALAGERGARTRQIDAETRAGVRMGAPVVVNDPEAGPIYTAPSAAIGRTPGARPLDDATAALRASQANLADARAATGGFAPTRGGPAAPQVRPLSRAETDTMAGTIQGLAGGKLDPTVSARILARATQIAQDPQSEWFRNPAGAAEAAVQEMAPGGFQPGGTRFVPFTGNGRVLAPHPGIAAAKAGETPATAGAVPPPAQRVKDRVYNTPRGPMKWSGTGWLPADM